jgi:tetratricopeptide (TPR) repeat protein
MQLLASGQDYERSGKLTSAQADYQKAQQLDPENKDAPKAYQRVTDIIADQKFQQLVSEGLSAYHKKDFQRAKQRLLSAKYLRPGSKEVISALAQVDQGIRSARIESLRQKGVKAEKTENWEKSLQAYQTVLKIDNNLQFAVQGEKRSLQQIEIDNQIAYFLENPGNLESDLQLENALLFIRQVDVMTPKGPNRTKALESLKRIVSAAQTPVKLIIESDNQTEVVLYRVGKLGRFDTREIQLRPGTYTVLGARDGYKDVRKQIVIKPGQGPLNVSVICKVEI